MRLDLAGVADLHPFFGLGVGEVRLQHRDDGPIAFPFDALHFAPRVGPGALVAELDVVGVLPVGHGDVRGLVAVVAGKFQSGGLCLGRALPVCRPRITGENRRAGRAPSSGPSRPLAIRRPACRR